MGDKLFPDLPILVVDDEKNFLNSIDFEMRSHRITNVECCQDSREVMPLLKKKKYSVILLDLLMPGINGKELLSKIVDEYPEIPVIIITALPETDTKKTVDYMKVGAFDCLRKPLEITEIIETIRDALGLKGVYKKITYLKKDLFSSNPRKVKSFPNIISQSDKMQAIFQTIGLIAVTSKPVLIRGEVGVGKEFVAREIHKQSYRKGKFIPFDLSGLDDVLFSETMFGHKRGGFPGTEKEGLVAEAKGGTLYLYDIADLHIQSQLKLLKLIRERQYCPVGSDKSIATNARIVVASIDNLSTLSKIGTFRQDLYNLLETHDIYIPPLREHREDIPSIVDYFLKKAAEENGIKEPGVPDELFEILETHDFPLNISELKRMIYEAVNRFKADILPLDVFLKNIKSNIHLEKQTFNSVSSNDKISAHNKIIFRSAIPTFSEMEAIYMDEILKRAKGDRSIAARLAGLKKNTFSSRLKKIRKQEKINKI